MKKPSTILAPWCIETIKIRSELKTESEGKIIWEQRVVRAPYAHSSSLIQILSESGPRHIDVHNTILGLQNSQMMWQRTVKDLQKLTHCRMSHHQIDTCAEALLQCHVWPWSQVGNLSKGNEICWASNQRASWHQSFCTAVLEVLAVTRPSMKFSLFLAKGFGLGSTCTVHGE